MGSGRGGRLSAVALLCAAAVLCQWGSGSVLRRRLPAGFAQRRLSGGERRDVQREILAVLGLPGRPRPRAPAASRAPAAAAPLFMLDLYHAVAGEEEEEEEAVSRPVLTGLSTQSPPPGSVVSHADTVVSLVNMGECGAGGRGGRVGVGDRDGAAVAGRTDPRPKFLPRRLPASVIPGAFPARPRSEMPLFAPSRASERREGGGEGRGAETWALPRESGDGEGESGGGKRGAERGLGSLVPRCLQPCCTVSCSELSSPAPEYDLHHRTTAGAANPAGRGRIAHPVAVLRTKQSGGEGGRCSPPSSSELHQLPAVGHR